MSVDNVCEYGSDGSKLHFDTALSAAVEADLEERIT